MAFPLLLGPEVNQGCPGQTTDRAPHLPATPSVFLLPPPLRPGTPCTRLYPQVHLPWNRIQDTNVNTTPQPSPPQRRPHESIASQHGRLTANKGKASLQGQQQQQHQQQQQQQQCHLQAKIPDAPSLKNRFVPFFFTSSHYWTCTGAAQLHDSDRFYPVHDFSLFSLPSLVYPGPIS